jgi:WD40 repeat protein
LWDPVTATPIGDPLAGHTGWVMAVEFGVLPDKRVLLATGSRDGTVRSWDPVNLAAGALHTYRTTPSAPWAPCFEQTTIYIGCDDGIIALDITDDIAATEDGGVH